MRNNAFVVVTQAGFVCQISDGCFRTEGMTSGASPVIFALESGALTGGGITLRIESDGGQDVFELGFEQHRVIVDGATGNLQLNVSGAANGSIFRLLSVDAFALLKWAWQSEWIKADSPASTPVQLSLGADATIFADGEALDAAQFATQGEHVENIQERGYLVTRSGRQLRLFKPLVYFNVFGKPHMFEMLRLAIQTLERYAGLTLHYLIVSDKDEEALFDLIPAKARSRVTLHKTYPRNRNEMLMSRYRIDDFSLQGFGPICYLDVDILCNGPLRENLLEMAVFDAIHIGTEHRGKTIAQIGLTGRWYGHFLFMAAKADYSRALCFNSGAMCFPAPRFAKSHFREVLELMDLYIKSGSPAVDNLGDQPFLSYVAQKNSVAQQGLMDKMIDIVFVESRRYSDNPTLARGLIHFNQGVGSQEKLEVMMRYYLDLLSAPAEKVLR